MSTHEEPAGNEPEQKVAPRKGWRKFRDTLQSAATDWSGFSFTLLEGGLWISYIAALLLVAGWAYADHYFALFGISLSALDSDVQGALYIYALWALRDGWWFLALAFAGLLAVLLLLWLWNRTESFWRPAAVLIIVAAMLASFIGVFELGHWRADRQVPKLIAQDYHAFPRVLIQAKESSAASQFLKDRNAGNSCLRKLFMDRKNLYLYPGYEDLRGAIPPVYIVPLSEISAIEIVRNPGLCSG